MEMTVSVDRVSVNEVNAAGTVVFKINYGAPGIACCLAALYQ